jgi:hypothetical protein
MGGGIGLASPFGKLRVGAGFRWTFSSVNGLAPVLIGDDLVIEISLSAQAE